MLEILHLGSLAEIVYHHLALRDNMPYNLTKYNPNYIRKECFAFCSRLICSSLTVLKSRGNFQLYMLMTFALYGEFRYKNADSLVGATGVNIYWKAGC